MVFNKKDKEKKKMKEFAKLLSGKKVEFRINENTISLYVGKTYLCGFTGKIMAEDYSKEKKDLDIRVNALNKREEKLNAREEDLKQSEKYFDKKEEKIEKLEKLAKLESERSQLIDEITED